jgi:hypothetical protein
MRGRYMVRMQDRWLPVPGSAGIAIGSFTVRLRRILRSAPRREAVTLSQMDGYRNPPREFYLADSEVNYSGGDRCDDTHGGSMSRGV